MLFKVDPALAFSPAIGLRAHRAATQANSVSSHRRWNGGSEGAGANCDGPLGQACLALSASTLAASSRQRKRLGRRSVRRQRTIVRYQLGPAQAAELDESRASSPRVAVRHLLGAEANELDEPEALVKQALELGQGSASAGRPPFKHPPRQERKPKKLPFSGDEKYWDFVVFPKALFPWSPESGGRPWDAWTETHKVRLYFVSAVHLGALAAPFTFSWGAFTAFAVLALVCTLGITLSYHRQLSHRAFECPKWLEYLFAYFGCLAVEGAPIGWVRMHRQHHVHSDKEDDIHSPMDGFWWSHVGFMFDASTTEKLTGVDNVQDLQKQEFYRLLDNANIYVMTSVVFPIVALYALGGLPYVIWGFCFRTVYIWHVNWAVNSIGHIWGYQSYDSGDNSQNNWVFGLLGFGDGWHNNHHAFPRSCRHGFEWWEVDLNWNFLQLLSACGLAWNLQLPSETRKQKLALRGA